MTSANESAINLLRRLLAGERGDLPMHLAMLLEKSSPLHNSDDHYRQILPPELAKLSVPPETADGIIARLCSEMRSNPDQAFILALSFTGQEKVTKVVTEVLVDPPRPLTVIECGHALAIVSSFLPACLARDPNFLKENILNRLMKRLRSLENSEERTIKRDALLLLTTLKGLAGA